MSSSTSCGVTPDTVLWKSRTECFSPVTMACMTASHNQQVMMFSVGLYIRRKGV